MADLSVADVLDRAADLIEPEGAWTQGCLFRKEDGQEALVSSERKACFCMAGAIVEAGGPCWSEAWDLLDSLLPKAVGLNATAAFNDAPERTQDEVVAKLREAAALARAKDPK